jgi:uncharacterized protein
LTPWLGYADFLGRVDEPSNLGAWSYEPVDTKLSRTAKPDHVIQLATYSKLIGNEQGRTPTEQGAWMNPATYPSTPKEVFEAAVLGEQRTLHIEEDVPSVRTCQAGKALPSTNGSVST